VRIDELLNTEELEDAIKGRLVSVRAHPIFPYVIYSYTSKAQYLPKMPKVARICRGLIVNCETNEIVARPFPKFYNYGEDGKSFDDLVIETVQIQDKLDGSLGIAYRGVDGKVYISTKGSFDSEQAEAGNAILRDKYPNFNPEAGVTYLFEIIGQSSRVVVDYGGISDLYLLARISIETGKTLDGKGQWVGPEVRRYYDLEENLLDAVNLVVNGSSLDDISKTIDGADRLEGFVITINKEMRWKLKFPDYVVLHKLISNMDEATIFDYYVVQRYRDTYSLTELMRITHGPAEHVERILSAADSFEEFLSGLPDEHYKAVYEFVEKLEERFSSVEKDVRERLKQFDLSVPRNEYALTILKEPNGRELLSYVVNPKKATVEVWRNMRPVNAPKLGTGKL
jgi:RNA ligase